jgi:hypothetical protein
MKKIEANFFSVILDKEGNVKNTRLLNFIGDIE